LFRVSKSIYIHAPAEKVFEYVADPANRPGFWPSLINVTDIEPLPNGGHRLKWVYKMAGMWVSGTGETIEHVPHRRTVDSNQGGISYIVAWRCDPEGYGTRFTFDCECSVHVPFLQRRSVPFLVKVNQDQADMIVANVKAGIEACCLCD
jgi:uncharacterized protein YndB with AHSA1/START domain